MELLKTLLKATWPDAKNVEKPLVVLVVWEPWQLFGALGVLEATWRRLGASGKPLEASWRSVLIVWDRFGVDCGHLLIPNLGPKAFQNISVGTFSAS